MHQVWEDIRFGLRQMAKSPALTAAAVVCLALGIGANSAAFSFVDSMLFWQPPVRQPERLVRLFVDWSTGLKYASFSYPDYSDLARDTKVLDGLVVEHLQPFHVSVDSENRRLAGYEVSADYFRVLEVGTALGRPFSPETEGGAPGSQPVAILSYDFWQSRLAADPGVLGRKLLVDGHPLTVVGVAPQGFYGVTNLFLPDLWIPIGMHDTLNPSAAMLQARGSHSLNTVVGRLAPGVGLAQARSALAADFARLAKEYPKTNAGTSLSLFRLAEAQPHPMIRGAFVAFFGLVSAVVAVVLLLAAANVAALLLARSAARRREIGTRLALGASRGRIVRQLLTESSLLAAAGGIAGLGLATVLIRLVRSLQPPTELPIRIGVSLSPEIVLLTLVVALGTGLLFGLAPALQATRTQLLPALAEGGRGGASRRATWLRKSLVVAQVALCLVLLVTAGMVLESLDRARHVDLGIRPRGVLVASLDIGLQGYDEARGKAFFRDLEERVRALPGVTAAGCGEILPLRLTSQQRGVVPEGYTVPEGKNPPSVDYNVVDPGYFAAMGVDLQSGRFFTDADREDSTPVAVVNQTFAERFWPGEPALGHQIRTGGKDVTVVGVVPTGRYFSLGEDPKPYFYLPLAQHYESSLVLSLRTRGDPLDLAGPLRRAVRELDPTLPVSDLETLEQSLGFAFLPARMAAQVVGAFAILALLLAAVGLYGVIAYSVSQELREIGIRMAMGARPRDVLRRVLGRGLRLTGLGLALGLAAGLGVTRLAVRALLDVSPTDPLAFGAGMAVLLAAALAASLLPARRATEVDPAEVLRTE